jgi:eukaryotic-like serine/threonine-protein kinase
MEPTTSSTESLIAQVISTWRAGLRPDTAEVLARHPHLRKHQSVLLDLAYEEYCLRKEAGETLSLESYCDRFPTCRRSLGRLLAIHECDAEDASLAADLDVEHVAWPAVDSEFLGFQLQRELGRGAFAHVYLARQPALGNRLVVVKVAQYGSGEAETLGRLAHRNIVPVHSVTEDPATHMTAVCMPYLGSATLLDVLDAGFAEDEPPTRARFIQNVAIQEALSQVVPEMYSGPDACLQHGTYVDGIVHLAVQLAEALQHTHQAGICHRDLKPSNVLLTPSGCPMLMDFNLSSDIQLERTFVGGTLPYMSPEQLRSMTVQDAVQDADGDPRSDLFSLGVILYELLTGHLPFGDRVPGATPAEAAEQLLARQRAGCPSVRRGNRQVSAALEAVLRQCLTLRADQRPASAQMLADALRRHFTPSAKLLRWARRRAFLIGAGVVAAGLFGGLAGAHMSARSPYDVREYDAGIRAFHAHEWVAAVDHFTRAHAARPNAWEPLFARGQALVARGQAYHATGDYLEAVPDLHAAFDMSPQGCTAAWLADGNDRAGLYLPAETYYAIAINEYGCESAAIWNNRACNALHRGTGRSAAVDHLTRAIKLDPRCQTAYHNRALLHSQRDNKVSSAGASPGQLAIQDIERAIELGPVHAALMMDAALIHAQHSKEAGTPERVVQYLQRAIDLGADREKILQNLAFGEAVLARIAAYPAAARVVNNQDLHMPLPNHFPPLFVS